VVEAWWYFLCALAAVNVVAWSISAVILKRRQNTFPAEAWSARRQQLLLSAFYVFGCAFRSVFPVFDVPRLGIVDSWLSSALIGRSVATVAELAFAAQWALMMRETAHATGSHFAFGVWRAVLPLIVLAEGFSWYSVLSTSNLGHVVEESIWGVTAALVVAGMVWVRPRCTPVPRLMRVAWAVAGFSYVAYLFFVDAPMYASRWLADEAAGRQYLGLVQGIFDAASRRVVTHSWADWRSEVVWMSLYFSTGVWASISLIYLPVPSRFVASSRRRRALPSLAQAR
jgi:hypothetical protein